MLSISTTWSDAGTQSQRSEMPPDPCSPFYPESIESDHPVATSAFVIRSQVFLDGATLGEAMYHPRSPMSLSDREDDENEVE
jgi:hypothetical protein